MGRVPFLAYVFRKSWFPQSSRPVSYYHLDLFTREKIAIQPGLSKQRNLKLNPLRHDLSGMLYYFFKS